MLNLEQKQEESELTIVLDGRIDTSTAPLLQAAVDPLPPAVNHVVLDFAKVDYISSAGLRVLLNLEQNLEETGGKLELCHVSDLIRDVFDITGFLDILTLN